MSTKRKLIVGGLVAVAAVLGVAAFQWETRYEMGQVSFPWQKSRKRLIAARALFGPSPRAPKAWSYRFYKDLTWEEQEEIRRRDAERNRSTCAALAKGQTDYVVRCVDPKGDER